MKHYDFDHKHDLRDLVFKYEVVSQKGTVLSLEETAFLQLVNFFEKEHSLEKAIKVIDQGIAQHKFSGILHLKKAELLLNLKDSDLALESIERAEIFGQPIKSTDLFRAKAFSQLGQYEDALGLLTNLRLSEYLTRKERSEICFSEAWIYEKQEQYERMYQSLKDALLENPKHPKALERIWIAVELCRRHTESIELHNYILDINPYSYRAWFNLGHAYYSSNRYEEAIEAFEYAFLINDKFELAYRDFAEVCFEMKQYDKALACYLEAMEHFDIDSDLLAKVGECYEYTNNISQAKIYFFRALGMDQRNDEVYYHIGECYAKEDLWSSAVHFYRQAIKLDEQREDYLFGLAKAYAKLGRKKKALPLFEKAIETAPEQTSYWVTYARYYLDKQEVRKALKIMETADCNTIGADISYCKAACLFLLDRRTEAIEAMREGLTENFKAHTFFFELLPHYREDADVKAIIHYFRYE